MDTLTGAIPTLDTDGVPIHLVTAEPALHLIAEAAERRPARPLAVASINLDHLHHFGRHTNPEASPAGGPVEWLNLIDGAPIAAHAKRETGQPYPKLSGSDLVVEVLRLAAARGLSVAVLGGDPAVTEPLRDRLGTEWPGARFAGHWTPPREQLATADGAAQVAEEIRAAGPDILLVCLGKPRQEQWIEQYGARSGAGVLLAFGAVVDFLAGRVARAPGWISRAGLEWAWRLMLEPRRLANRYLVQGPPAYLALRRSARPALRGAALGVPQHA
ncbi:WecB/TagA/CpsF family glycosyltransferase [Microbacterium sp. JZ31]|uniref:WecB/TagA/CpsF family glycosyltransferase n=1 Tax=Microbacterium sp. JZ31 TaxID=1906274 RepID=UPI0019340EE3|nr:WecB/TagA/CpsF family glycosyltransferase [Microbacterium sp. JZ31]